MIDPVEVHVVLNTTPDKAFRAFTADINNWWPVQSHSISKGVVHLHPEVGGEIVETAKDGAVHIWGHVTKWSPPNELAIEWYVGRTPKEGTQIHVTFAASDDGRTGITLVHSGWEVLGDGAADTREGYNSGWNTMLKESFAPYCEA